MEVGSVEYNATSGLGKGGLLKEFIQLQDVQASSESTCLPYLTPSVAEYFGALSTVTTAVVFTLGGVAVLITFTLFADTLRHILKNGVPGTKSYSIYVISIYPLVAVATLSALAIPRAQLVTEAVIQIGLMTSMYKLFCLLLTYSGGESELVQKANPDTTIPLRVGPCCCWPCFSVFLPNLAVTKSRICILRLIVLQMPIIQGLFYIIFLMMWAEDEAIYQNNYSYLQPVIFCSILFGMWGITMTTKFIKEVLKNYYVPGKVGVLQLVLLVTKLENVVVRLLISNGVFPCKYPISSSVFGNLIYNSIVLWEIVLLAALARILYKRPIPDVKTSNLPQQLVTLSGADTKTVINENDKDTIIVRF